MEDIVRAAQTSRACFYTYFKNKDDVLITYVHINDESYLKFYQNTLCSKVFSNKDGIEKLKALLNYAIDLLTSNGAHLLHLYFIALIKDPPLSSNRERHLFQIMRVLFDEASQESVVKDGLTFDAFQEMALWVLRGTCFNWAGSDGTLPPQHQHAIIEQFINCIRKS